MFRSDDGAAFSEARVPDDAEDKGGRYLNLSAAPELRSYPLAVEGTLFSLS